MSYRAIKRLLGETSLERKCRFLFGGALMLLITGSFYLYAQLNLRLLQDQNRERARLVVSPRLLAHHSKNEKFEPAFKQMHEELLRLKVGEDLADEYEFDLYKPTTQSAETSERAYDLTGHQAVAKLRGMNRAGVEPLEMVIEIPEKDEYRFYQGLLATDTCLQCHYHAGPDVAVGDFIGVAEVKFPLSRTTLPVRRNNAVLIAMALLTASLAMLAAYVIVRYVIVKPVLHLQDVSDAIAHGDLDQRADIRTGDEFEELSHAFNRMLRHLVTVQDELRQVNSNLDKKVDELAQANLSLHEMNKMKGDFLATMSHELRTPLNSILGFSDVLAGADNISDKQRKFLSNIQASGQNLLTLINDILDLAKVEAAKMEVHIAEFDVAELVERLVNGIRPLAERKNIELRWEADERLPIANQDAGKLQQIFDNLLSNAVKFTPEGGRILVQACYEPDEWLVLVVADTGIGIPLDDQATIFEKFRQGSVAADGDKTMLTREYEGTGLGLSIVKELTRLLGGEVFLESEFGKGSTFSVRIPLRLEPGAGSLEDSREHQTLGLRRSLREEATAGARGGG